MISLGDALMKHDVSEKYSVAWFKLADCVSRGEKERALGVYRLLAHSLEDSAFAQQLEADLLLSFKDEKAAFDKYCQAANVYKKQGNILQAAAVYEHALTMQPDHEACRKWAINAYLHAGLIEKSELHQKVLCERLIDQEKWQDCAALLQEWASHARPAFMNELYELWIIKALESSVRPRTSLIIDQAHEYIQHLLHYNSHNLLQRFISKIRAIDPLFVKNIEVIQD